MGSVIAVFGLALLDSLSIGTLVIPLALIIRWRTVKTPALTVYLSTVAAVYFLLGIAILLGFSGLSTFPKQFTQTSFFPWITLILGVALAGFGVFARTPRKPNPGEMPKQVPNPRNGVSGMLALGLGASLTEAATMLPYIAAMGIISSWDVSPVAKASTVGIYCLVMVIPALTFVALALAFKEKVIPLLERIAPRMEYEAKVTLLWVAAIVGIYMVVNSIGMLNLGA